MTCVYTVRCKFTAPEKEPAWHAWYSGPKLEQMLAQPYFLTCQRFRRVSGTGRDWLALWTVSQPEALTTREYRSQWGFAEWQSYITDWSRDLFDAGDTPESAFAVAPDGVLRVTSFEGLSAAEADRARGAMSEPGLRWLPSIALDSHTPMIGLKTLPGEAALPATVAGVNDGLYRPIIPLHVRR